MTLTGKFLYMDHHFILLQFNPFGIRVDKERWLTPLWGWSSLTVKLTGTFVYMAHHFILLWLNPFGLRVDREGWGFDHSMSVLSVCYWEEGAKNVSWPSISLLWGWDSLTMTLTCKLVNITHDFILLRLNPFDVRVP